MTATKLVKSRAGRGCVVVPIGLLLAAAVWVLVAGLRRPLHPEPAAIPTVARAAPSPEWAGAVERARLAVLSEVGEQNLPGLSVAVGAGGRVAWAEGFGWSDLAAGSPLTPETRFKIGTVSTVLTAAAAGMLVEKGRLALDEEIQRHVPEFAKKQRAVTLRQLMGHTAGIGSDGGAESPLFLQRCEKPAEALKCFAGDALLFEPGTQFRPSKYGWILVSAAVEAAAGQPLLEFMDEQIFKPLGMRDTGAEPAEEENPERMGEPGEDAPIFTLVRHLILEPLGAAERKRKAATEAATIYSAGWGPRPNVRYGLHEMPVRNLSCYAGAMSLFSTPTDLVRFGLAMDGGRLLRPETVRLLQTPQRLSSGEETGYGLGWELGSVQLGGRTTQVAGHEGELLGRKVASLMMLGGRRLVVAVMSNCSYGDTRSIALKVAEAFAQAERQ